ncbi:MAG TPA: aminotransferase class IV [Bryobacteraceae bacterium]|nr:aminotransferase class IV [Bryobacteraceae bacterium]
MHPYVLHNDEILRAEQTCLSAGQVGFMTGWGVFSTIRVSQGVLFAFERHFRRMQRDAKLLRVPFPERSEFLEERLQKLVEANRATEATLRVNIVRNRGGLFEGPALTRDFDIIGFTADLNNWGEGVKLGVQPHARHAANLYAGTKVTSWMFNLNMYEQAHERGLDEVVLLNEREEVSECTSANIFAVFGNEVVTPPLSSGCLPGVTRELLLEEVRTDGIRVTESTLRLPDLQLADELFITSTTREILPVLSIEGLRTNQGLTWKRLLESFRHYADSYVGSKVFA